MLSASMINLIVDGVEKNKKMIEFYQKSLKGYPDGCISIKKINGKEYCYINVRKGKQITSKYYSNNKESIESLKNKIIERNHYKNQIRMLSSELKDLETILKRYNNEKIRQRRRVLEFGKSSK